MTTNQSISDPKHKCPFKQLLYSLIEKGTDWIHLTCVLEEAENRQRIRIID